MTTLIFKHEEWTVVTNSWTVASKDKRRTVVCYQWSAEDGWSWWGNSSTGVAQVVFDMPIDEFLLALRKAGPMLDLR